jgi:anti-sigma factor RsiW
VSRKHHNIDRLLLTLFYRHSCPAPETLGDYYLGRLPPGQRLAIAQHLRLCPHCTQELSLYGEENKGAVSAPMAWFHRAVSRVRWALAAPELLPTLAVRGAPYAQQAYKADSIEIMIEISPARVGYRRLDLMGQIQPAEAANSVELWDASTASTVAIQPVDEMGYFEFRQLSPGNYFLCLRAGEAETWLGQVAVTLPET